MRGAFLYGKPDEALRRIREHNWLRLVDPSWAGVHATSECVNFPTNAAWGDEAHPDTALAGELAFGLLGLRPTSPGFRTYVAEPCCGSLEASGVVPTARGPIKVGNRAATPRKGLRRHPSRVSVVPPMLALACLAALGGRAAPPDPPEAPPRCRAAEIVAAVAATPDGGTVRLPSGRVYLERSVEIVGRTNLTVRGGEDTVVVLRYSPWEEPVWRITPRFKVENCAGVSFKGFRVTTDNPVNASGRVVAKNPADGTYEAQIDPQFPITGREHIYGSDTFDEEGMPDYAIETYDDRNVRTETLPDGRPRIVGLAYEVVGPQRIRVKAPSAAALGRLRIGHRVLYRYTIYGHAVFSVAASRDVALRDIAIERCPSFGAEIRPLSENVTLERFSISPPDGDRALYAANADGVHVLGLAGTFAMRDCRFRGLGDDALNIHAKAGRIGTFDAGTGALSVVCRDANGGAAVLPRGWARAGDTLAVYDAATLRAKARLSVKSWRSFGLAAGAVVAPLGDGADAVSPGDFLANERDFPAVEIERCSVENTRARGFVLQSRRMRIRDCAFRGLALPGILVAPDFRKWFEAGPAEDLEISGCTFEKCAMNGSPANLGAIAVKTSHDGAAGDLPAGVHRNVRIVGNAFRGCGAAGVFVASTSGVEVRGNEFEDGWRNPPPGSDPERRDVRLVNCDDIR